VKCHDNVSEESATSSFFVIGKQGTCWEENWITAGFIQNEQTAYAAEYLRKSFQIDKPVSLAILVVCGLGFFEAYINGNKTVEDMVTASDQLPSHPNSFGMRRKKARLAAVPYTVILL
jgi:alpha-L-rhamnosidase